MGCRAKDNGRPRCSLRPTDQPDMPIPSLTIQKPSRFPPPGAGPAMPLLTPPPHHIQLPRCTSYRMMRTPANHTGFLSETGRRTVSYWSDLQVRYVRFSILQSLCILCGGGCYGCTAECRGRLFSLLTKTRLRWRNHATGSETEEKFAQLRRRWTDIRHLFHRSLPSSLSPVLSRHTPIYPIFRVQ